MTDTRKGVHLRALQPADWAQATLTAGLLDLLFALSLNAAVGVSPAQVLKYIASGAFGVAAFGWGWGGAAAGLVLHFMIMGLFVAGMAVAAGRIPMLAGRALLSGAVGGVLMFAVMNGLVVPLSATPPVQPAPAWRWGAELAAHIVLVGIPTALVLGLRRRSLKPSTAH